MIAEINFVLTDDQKVACDEANFAYHHVALENNNAQYVEAEKIYDALMAAWAFIGEINGDWIQ